MMVEVTTSEGLNNSINKNGLTIVKFGAEWCGPCKMMDGVLSNIATKRSDVAIVKINVEEADELVEEYHISNVPVILIFKDGELSTKHIGSLSENKLLEIL